MGPALWERHIAVVMLLVEDTFSSIILKQNVGIVLDIPLTFVHKFIFDNQLMVITSGIKLSAKLMFIKIPYAILVYWFNCAYIDYIYIYMWIYEYIDFVIDIWEV